jgi:hypothetical protein
MKLWKSSSNSSSNCKFDSTKQLGSFVLIMERSSWTNNLRNFMKVSALVIKRAFHILLNKMELLKGVIAPWLKLQGLCSSSPKVLRFFGLRQLQQHVTHRTDLWYILSTARLHMNWFMEENQTFRFFEYLVHCAIQQMTVKTLGNSRPRPTLVSSLVMLQNERGTESTTNVPET